MSSKVYACTVLSGGHNGLWLNQETDDGEASWNLTFCIKPY